MRVYVCASACTYVCGHLCIYVHVCVYGWGRLCDGCREGPAGMAMPTSEPATASLTSQKALCVCISLGLCHVPIKTWILGLKDGSSSCQGLGVDEGGGRE